MFVTALMFIFCFGVVPGTAVWLIVTGKSRKEKEDQEFIALVKRTREELGPTGAEDLTDEVLLAELRRRKKVKEAKAGARDLLNDPTEPLTLNPVFRELRFGPSGRGS